ncbi:hypothetical protein SS50377_21207 [Spironucleus salmonicida]|uniref:Uncharacterized protein n=1 Tax=Spironucleus salmonicida TaxID=348837 RepID=V6LJT6_9EUKA|nr:hypothetical protein SS50377_21207 [Spironucleus salmonicida]|eukprot:EST43981.1 Hypothetical protein SS50377_16289 [Spironucleus salmonicida]
MSVDINSILAKYGSKKPKPAFSPVKQTTSQDIAPLVMQYPVEQNIPTSYFDRFAQEAKIPYTNFYDEPVNQMKISQLQSSVSNVQDNKILAKESLTKQVLDNTNSEQIEVLKQQIREVRQDVNALHRDLLDLKASENAHFKQLSDMIKIILERTE